MHIAKMTAENARLVPEFCSESPSDNKTSDGCAPRSENAWLVAAVRY